MRLSPTNVASLVLSGIMTTTALAGVHQPPVQAEDANNQTTPDQAQQTKLSKPESNAPEPDENLASSAAEQPLELQQSPKPETARKAGPARKKSTIEPIEPFIKADAVALGQWLMTKTVKTLVTRPTTPKSRTGSTAQQATKPVAKAEPTVSTNATQPQPPKSQPTLPKVAVKALPPEPSNNLTIDGYTEMRVAVAKQISSVTVAASAGAAIISADGELIENLPANVGYQVSADARGLFVNGQPVPSAIWLEPDNGYVSVGDRWYRGRLLLLWQNGGVMAINHVLLRDYLYSVVGAEMSASWSLEALKAQAVAARSYAIVHTVRHQRRPYDLDDTQRYQVYKGIATEASSTQQAVHETAGEFISYDGGVVESLYAANQEIVDDAHRGYGMSQTGALDLAEQGYQYYEILSAYYPDTSVGRIDIGD